MLTGEVPLYDITVGVWCAVSATSIIRIIFSSWNHKFQPMLHTHKHTHILTYKLHTSKYLCDPWRWPRAEAETFNKNIMQRGGIQYYIYHHHHLATMGLGHFLTFLEGSLMVSLCSLYLLVCSFLIILGNLLRDIQFTCCSQFLLYCCILSKNGVVFSSFAVSAFVL